MGGRFDEISIDHPMSLHFFSTTIAIFACLAATIAHAHPTDLVLRYDRPASTWQSEALPLGNGRLGCMAFGGVPRERLQFNEDSLWIGDETDTGAYQAFGDVSIEFDHKDHQHYSRRLDLRDAVYSQAYESGGVRYARQYFASNPAQALVFRFTADNPGAYSGRLQLTDTHGAKIVVEGDRITADGDLRGFVYPELKRRETDKPPYRVALQYEAQVVVLHEGGKLTVDGDNALAFQNCDSLTVLLAAGTNYIADRSKGWTGDHPHQRVTSQINAAAERRFDELLDEHRRDYQSLFSRVTLNLGKSSEVASSLTTDARLKAYSPDEPDHDLEELLFHYARYLMISSSRPGARPANLQGIWNESNKPVWRSDYHSDVNTEMNYWFVDAANLSECFLPLADWLYSIREVRRDATFVELGKPGWALRAENGLFGGSTWLWSKGDAAWLAQNLWDHYAFTRDKDYLRDRAYPIQNDLCEFWLADLKELPTGELVSPLGFSPEHGPHEDGVSFDQQLVWDLFTNTIEASEALGVDEALRAELVEKRARLLGPQIGRWGQLQEWMVDRDDPNDDHRHVSHMIAIHPGRQISPRETPELAEAARVSLNARPDGSTGWSMAWKAALWARLHEGERAYQLVNRLFVDGAKLTANIDAGAELDRHAGGVMGNLLDSHPPFQIDGNFGYAAAVCEMLVQSHLGYVELLPALPDAWRDGSFTGLCVRGGFEMDLSWREGEPQTLALRSARGGDCRVLTTEGVSLVDDNSGKAIKKVGPYSVIAIEPGGAANLRVVRRR
jgi:alpha-L-fucosidase 2